jgi:branched-chain amino acid aminotransferase
MWFKGALVRVEDAQINVLAPTSQFGLNVFEGIRCYWDDEQNQLFAFRLQDHLRRLIASANVLGIRCPYTIQELNDHFTSTIRANGYREDTAVRMTLFIDGDGSWSSLGPVEMFIAPIPKPRTDLAKISCLSACVSTWQRINDNSLPPRIKVGANYINGRYGHLEAQRNGYDVPIFLGADGKVAEGAGATLFLRRGRELFTPNATSSVLESITRVTLMKLASEMDISVHERVVDRTELYMADEVFLCGSAAELQPVGSVDRYIVGSGSLGPITRQLLVRYHDAVSGKIPEHKSWCEPIYR